MIKLRQLLLSAPALVIALTLSAVAAETNDADYSSVSSLTAATSAVKAPDANGFIPRWLLLEPIPVAGQVTQNAAQATVKTEYFPNQLTVIPKDGDKLTVVTNMEVVWRAVDTRNYNVNLYHFGYALKKKTSNAIFWAVTIVNCPEETPNVRLAIGSNAASFWWVNGQELVSIFGDRQTVIDDGVSKRITLKKGPNVLRVAVVNNGGATDFCARFIDEAGNPLKNFTISLSDTAQ